MAYRRRYRRRRTRRRPRRYPLSRFNTYRYRSAKSQANQIYRINRKINNIEKRTKPEIKIAQNTYNFSMSEYCGEIFGGLTTLMHNSIKGRIARIQDVHGWFNIWKSPSVAENNFTSTIRIVVFQIRQSMSSTDLPLHARDLMNITAAEEDSTDQTVRKRAYMRAMFGPLRYGISSKINVLRDFRVSISPDRQRSSKRIKLRKPFTMMKSQTTGEVYPEHAIFFVALYTSNKASMTQDEVQFQYITKVAYVDED